MPNVYLYCQLIYKKKKKKEKMGSEVSMGDPIYNGWNVRHFLCNFGYFPLGWFIPEWYLGSFSLWSFLQPSIVFG